MSFFLGFKTFDPKTGIVPNKPFSSLPQIARRARSVLKNRTSEQIVSVAHSIDWAINEYFEHLKCEAISTLENQMRYGQLSEYELEKFFDLESCPHREGEYAFKTEMAEELDIPTAWSVSARSGLLSCIDYWDDIGGDDFPNGSPAELFAVLSLWLLENTIYWMNERTANVGQIKFANGEIEHLTKQRPAEIAKAGSSAIEAMEVICNSEQLQMEEKLHSEYQKTEELRQQTEQKKRSMKSEKLNIERHRKTNEAKNDVLSEWSKAPSDFPSAEKAGLHFYGWLKDQGRDYEPRTITGWIRAHAKESGIRFR
jgi:hypothetical protein